MKVPHHIAVIMDGNGRWAKSRGLVRTFGHKKGVDRVREIVRESQKLGVKIITVFAFSTENWNRPKKEVGLLFSYLDIFLHNYKKELMADDIKLNVIGRRDRINPKIMKKIEKVEDATKNNKSFIFNIALDYGGRWDIIHAVRTIAGDCVKGNISEADINEDYFKEHLCLKNMPDPDLLVRTSGEHRISNFMLWNLAYTELYFPRICWPDFDREELKKAIAEYSGRERRYGKI